MSPLKLAPTNTVCVPPPSKSASAFTTYQGAPTFVGQLVMVMSEDVPPGAGKLTVLAPATQEYRNSTGAAAFTPMTGCTYGRWRR
jgi:hypothetical protein